MKQAFEHRLTIIFTATRPMPEAELIDTIADAFQCVMPEYIPDSLVIEECDEPEAGDPVS